MEIISKPSPVVAEQRIYSEPVEKGSQATPYDFRIIKNQEVRSDRKPKNDRSWSFSTASAVMFYLENDASTYQLFTLI
jgi:hypothetical protein